MFFIPDVPFLHYIFSEERVLMTKVFDLG